MWSQVQHDLENLLAAKIYSCLVEDAVYRAFLVSAGFRFSGRDYSIPPNLQKNFNTAAKIRAHIIVSEVERSEAILESSAGAKLCHGPVQLYRLWDGGSPERRQSVWWFEPAVIEACKKNTPRSPEVRKQWLREHLAVPLDWSKLNRIDYISLKAGDELPVILGTGRPMPVYSPDAVSSKQSTTSGKPMPMAKATPKEYFDNLGKFFAGGMRQTILPFIPHATGMDINAFLNKG